MQVWLQIAKPGANVGVGVADRFGVGDAVGTAVVGVGEAVGAAPAETVMTEELVGMAAISSPLDFAVTTVLPGSNARVKGVAVVADPPVTVNDSRVTGVLLMNPDCATYKQPRSI